MRKIKCFIAILMLVITFVTQSGTVSIAGAERCDLQSADAQESTEESAEASDNTSDSESVDNQESADGQNRVNNQAGTDEQTGTNNQAGSDETDEDTDAQEAPKLEMYDLSYDKPTGENDYYVKKPKVTIIHNGEAGVTCYKLLSGNKTVKMGELDTENRKATLDHEDFSEGKSELLVWMEKEENQTEQSFGEEETQAGQSPNEESESEQSSTEKKRVYVEDSKKTCTFQVDTVAPEVDLSAPQGFETWYDGETSVSVSGKDDTSGVAKLAAFANDHKLGEEAGKQAVFEVKEPSVGGKGIKIAATVCDRAGNESKVERTLYVDGSYPEVRILGIENQAIVNRGVRLNLQVEEENQLAKVSGTVEIDRLDGRKRKIDVTGFSLEGTLQNVRKCLQEDGRYKIILQAEDMAGHSTTEKLSFVIDKKSPVIRYVDELNHTFLQSFTWNYLKTEAVADFSSFAYEIRLDNQLYHTGKLVTDEGSHKLEVIAVDAAGNKAKAEATFVIDHTAPKINIEGISQNGVYPSKAACTVSLENDQDSIMEISVNGRKQELAQNKRVQELTFSQAKEYEVLVKAEDEAGNSSERSVVFKVKAATLTEKITNPVKNIWKNSSNQYVKTKGEKDKKEKITPLYMGGVVVVLLSIFVVHLAAKRK